MGLRSADGTLDVEVSEWAVTQFDVVGRTVATDGVPEPAMEGEFNAAAQAVTGTFPDFLADAFAQNVRDETSRCPDADVDAHVRVFYEGLLGGPRVLSFDSVVRAEDCANSAHVLGYVVLSPE